MSHLITHFLKSANLIEAYSLTLIKRNSRAHRHLTAKVTGLGDFRIALPCGPGCKRGMDGSGG